MLRRRFIHGLDISAGLASRRHDEPRGVGVVERGLDESPVGRGCRAAGRWSDSGRPVDSRSGRSRLFQSPGGRRPTGRVGCRKPSSARAGAFRSGRRSRLTGAQAARPHQARRTMDWRQSASSRQRRTGRENAGRHRRRRPATTFTSAIRTGTSATRSSTPTTPRCRFGKP